MSKVNESLLVTHSIFSISYSSSNSKPAIGLKKKEVVADKNRERKSRQPKNKTEKSMRKLLTSFCTKALLDIFILAYGKKQSIEVIGKKKRKKCGNSIFLMFVE